MEDVVEHDSILFPNWVSGSAWSLTGPSGKTSVPVQGRLTLNNLEGVRIAALKGCGLALLPESHCQNDLREGTLRRVLPKLGWSSGGLWVVYSRTRFLSAKVRAFADYMQKEYAAS